MLSKSEYFWRILKLRRAWSTLHCLEKIINPNCCFILTFETSTYLSLYYLPLFQIFLRVLVASQLIGPAIAQIFIQPLVSLFSKIRKKYAARKSRTLISVVFAQDISGILQAGSRRIMQSACFYAVRQRGYMPKARYVLAPLRKF